VVHQQVAPPHGGEDVDPLAVGRRQPGGRDPLVGRILEVGPVEGVHGPQPGQVERPDVDVHVLVGHVELAL
jgi:hypothetical protein